MPTQIFETVKQIIDVPNNFSGQTINASGVGEGWSGGADGIDETKSEEVRVTILMAWSS